LELFGLADMVIDVIWEVEDHMGGNEGYRYKGLVSLETVRYIYSKAETTWPFDKVRKFCVQAAVTHWIRRIHEGDVREQVWHFCKDQRQFFFDFMEYFCNSNQPKMLLTSPTFLTHENENRCLFHSHIREENCYGRYENGDLVYVDDWTFLPTPGRRGGDEEASRAEALKDNDAFHNNDAFPDKNVLRSAENDE
jgi:hypothetical protein